METLDKNEVRRQKVGGAAALYLAFALLAAMPYFLIVVDYLGATTADEKIALIAANYTSMYAMYIVTYVLFGFALGVLNFSLYDRLKNHAPALIRAAVAIGLFWSFALVASGMVFTYGMTTIVALDKVDPSQARGSWLAIETVAEALGGAGGEILGGVWVLLVSVVALRSGLLPKVLAWFGLVMGAAGLLSVIPPLHDVTMVFGLMQILWLVWLAMVLLTKKIPGANPGK